MRKVWMALGMLVLLGFPLPCSVQGGEPAKNAVEPESSGASTSRSSLPDEITFKSDRGDVLFPHKYHVMKQKLKCGTCHHQIHARELDTPHPDYLETARVNCQVCHEPETEDSQRYYKCEKCHYSQPKDYADETLSAKVVIHKNCWKCHDRGTGAEVSEKCVDCHRENEP